MKPTTQILVLSSMLTMGLFLSARRSAHAQSTPKVFFACYVPNTGTVYRIREPGLRRGCFRNHHSFSWVDGLPGYNHGVLNGLADDDHPQYLLADGTRALGGDLNAAGNRIRGLGAGTVAGDAVRFEQAVKVGDGAGGDLLGTYPNPSVARLQGNSVSTTAPTSGQVLAFDGSAWTPATPAAGGGVSDHGALAGLTDDDHPQYLLGDGVRASTNGFAVTGTFGSGAIPATGPGVRLMWYPGKAAFRAGRVQILGEWDDANIGPYSAAMGALTVASGTASTAMGLRTAASGHASTAMGEDAAASGPNSTAMGSRTQASAFFSTAMGEGTTASGHAATAMGRATTASGESSTAMGHNTTAGGEAAFAVGRNANAFAFFSTAMGVGTTASGHAATAMGEGTEASGARSTAMGEVTTSQAYASLVIGRFNVVAGNPFTWDSSDPLFVAGNGVSGNPSNALTLLKNGDLIIAGTFTSASDVRLKDEIEPLEGALERVLKLAPIRYRFREGASHPRDRKIGLSAQAVEPLFPELVRRGPDGYLSVAYADLSAVLVRAIQEQQGQIEALRTELAALRAEIAQRLAVLDRRSIGAGVDQR